VGDGRAVSWLHKSRFRRYYKVPAGVNAVLIREVLRLDKVDEHHREKGIRRVPSGVALTLRGWVPILLHLRLEAPVVLGEINAKS